MFDLPDVTSPSVLRNLFARHGLSPRRQWGQNFLIDANIVAKITAALDSTPGRSALEIGPGAGALTMALAKSGYQILALEIDRGLAGLLKQTVGDRLPVKVICEDALKVKWSALLDGHFGSGQPVKLISNLPYVISGPFMFSILREAFPFSAAVLMFQKEVARRLVAVPGDPDYGALSVLCRYYTIGKILFAVSSNVFWPKPKVGSSVIMLLPRQPVLEKDQEPLFWTIVQGVFQQRRKTIYNNLERLLPRASGDLHEVLAGAGIFPSARPEELNVGQFANLVRIIYNLHQ